MDICFATNNQHKLEEIKALLGSEFNLLSLMDIGCFEELKEEGKTLEENSMQKAAYVHNNYQISCFADDTGLEVEALNGDPGVYSARYAGDHKNNEDNIELLLEKLGDKKNRNARFRTVITLIIQSVPYVIEGIVEGKIIQEKRGKAGFGYDPIFVPTGLEKTFAEMTMKEKGNISHRGKAVMKLIQFLKSLPKNKHSQ